MSKNVFDGDEGLTTDSIRKYLRTKKLGRDIHFLPRTDSTQTIGKSLAGTGAEEGLLVVADSQYKGRGRHSHTWESPEKVNLYYSLLFRPKNPFWPLRRANEIQFMSSLAVAEGLKKHCQVQVDLKWPNDLRLNGKKIGGIILTTSSPNPKQLDYVLMGMGLNVNASEEDFSEEIKKIATSLFQITQKKLNRPMLLAYLLNEIEDHYELLQSKGFSAIQKDWIKWASHMVNENIHLQDVLVDPKDTLLNELQGKAKGIDGQGRLLVETSDGKTLAVIDGMLVS